MVVFPNAKINIGLHITSRRPDGYHDIETVMIPVPWCDVLEIVPSESGDTTLTVTGRAVACPPEKNLVMKAYRALDATVTLPPLDIYLRKIIPDGAGLGGGSADAAFTVMAINRMLKLNLTDSQMAEICSSIGADCPYFIYNRPMIATGTGTTLSPIDLTALNGMTVALVKPDISVPTAEAYAGVTPKLPVCDLPSLLNTPVSLWKDRVANDFEASIASRHRVIAEIKQQLYSLGAIYASMSGSGSAVYGIFDSDIMSPDIAKHFSDHDTFVGKFTAMNDI